VAVSLFVNSDSASFQWCEWPPPNAASADWRASLLMRCSTPNVLCLVRSVVATPASGPGLQPPDVCLSIRRRPPTVRAGTAALSRDGYVPTAPHADGAISRGGLNCADRDSWR
jgi:hypothetical protein